MIRHRVGYAILVGCVQFNTNIRYGMCSLLQSIAVVLSRLKGRFGLFLFLTISGVYTSGLRGNFSFQSQWRSCLQAAKYFSVHLELLEIFFVVNSLECVLNILSNWFSSSSKVKRVLLLCRETVVNFSHEKIMLLLICLTSVLSINKCFSSEASSLDIRKYQTLFIRVAWLYGCLILSPRFKMWRIDCISTSFDSKRRMDK